MVRLSGILIARNIMRFMLLALVFLGLLAACTGQQPAQTPAGTSTQDPPVPQLTEATHVLNTRQGFLFDVSGANSTENQACDLAM